MSNIGTIKRRKLETKRQQIINRGLAKAKRKQERKMRKRTAIACNVHWTDVFEDPTEPVTIYDDFGCGA